MRRVRLKDEVERLNFSVEAIAKTFKSLLVEGKIWGIIDDTSEEFICFSSEEVSNLTATISPNRVFCSRILDTLRRIGTREALSCWVTLHSLYSGDNLKLPLRLQTLRDRQVFRAGQIKQP